MSHLIIADSFEDPCKASIDALQAERARPAVEVNNLRERPYEAIDRVFSATLYIGDKDPFEEVRHKKQVMARIESLASVPEIQNETPAQTLVRVLTILGRERLLTERQRFIVLRARYEFSELFTSAKTG